VLALAIIIINELDHKESGAEHIQSLNPLGRKVLFWLTVNTPQLILTRTQSFLSKKIAKKGVYAPAQKNTINTVDGRMEGCAKSK